MPVSVNSTTLSQSHVGFKKKVVPYQKHKAFKLCTI